MNKVIAIPIFAFILLLIDYYVFQGVIAATASFSSLVQQQIYYGYWGITLLTLIGLFIYHFVNPFWLGRRIRTGIMVWIFTNYISKFFVIIVMLFDEIRRGFQWIYDQILSFNAKKQLPEPETISRSSAISQAGLIVGAVPVLAIGWGIVTGAHDYRVRRRTITLPHLPKEFDGIRIGQISDIHSGSFWNRRAVQGGVELLNKEKPDMIFFTGDLVNNEAGEMRDYVSVFGKITAPLGVYSTLGNHDYGDYVRWPSKQAKIQNLQKLMETHRAMGWDLLMNEHRVIQEGDSKLAVLGIENWSAKGQFPKYGSLANAYNGTEQIPVKILLSHDPSHWMAEVIPQYSDIDLMLSGHTHGMQFGVEVGDFRWSPVKYVYKEWADLYQSGQQYLYVNRGFGYLGFPGRIGMPPEITIIELKRG